MDFFQLNDETIVIITRILIAASLAGLIGIEREYKRHPAGFRTHLLVGTASCLLMLLALFGFQSYLAENQEVVRYDPSRLASYVVSGVGFLGAGTIIVQGVSVKGLTTAASIWVVAAIGLATGAGMYFPAIFTTIIVLLSLFFLNNVDHFIKKSIQKNKLEIYVKADTSSLANIIAVLEEHHIKVKRIKGMLMEEKDKEQYAYIIHMKSGNLDASARVKLQEEILSCEGVISLEMES